jgi:predicted HD superfamily hydrolase involved in NAD metabolism
MSDFATVAETVAETGTEKGARSETNLREKTIAWLRENVSEHRVQHILGVEAMSVELAQIHGLDVEKAALAGLMHDLAKYFKPQRLLEMAEAEGLELDPVDLVNPHLLHADVGAIVARDDFQVTDEEVLMAIADHTLGRPGMSALSCVVFLADSLEPGRGDEPILQELRQHSHQNLITAVWHTCDYGLQHLITARKQIHPRTIRTRNWAMSEFLSAASAKVRNSPASN